MVIASLNMPAHVRHDGRLSAESGCSCKSWIQEYSRADDFRKGAPTPTRTRNVKSRTSHAFPCVLGETFGRKMSQVEMLKIVMKGAGRGEMHGTESRRLCGRWTGLVPSIKLNHSISHIRSLRTRRIGIFSTLTRPLPCHRRASTVEFLGIS